VGKIVTALNVRAGRLSVMAQNPYNAVIHLGHSNGQFRDFPFFFFKDLFIYLFIICKYTVVVFRHTRRRRQISLRMVVSHHVVAGI
jgi:hypothetical protein